MSTIHRLHPLTGEWNDKEYDDNPDCILFDDCPRCEEHAIYILTLDDNNLKLLWDEMVQVEFDNRERDYYRNSIEAEACRYLYHVAILIRRMFGFDPMALKDFKGIYNALSTI